MRWWCLVPIPRSRHHFTMEEEEPATVESEEDESVAASILKTIYDGRTFETWEEVTELTDRLRDELFMPIVFNSSRTTKSANTRVNSCYAVCVVIAITD